MMSSSDENVNPIANGHDRKKEENAIEFAQQAEHLAQYKRSKEDENTGSTQAVEAKFITPLDPVIETANGGRLPVIPVEEAVRLNKLKEMSGVQDAEEVPLTNGHPTGKDGSTKDSRVEEKQEGKTDAPLRSAVPPSR